MNYLGRSSAIEISLKGVLGPLLVGQRRKRVVRGSLSYGTREVRILARCWCLIVVVTFKQ